jgi:hypothetical protein
MSDTHPTVAELAFLNLTYPRFLALFDEVMGDQFWSESDRYRFDRIVVGFAIYSELLNYKPIQLVIKRLKSSRPPMEAEIGSDLFKFVRNVVVHFPVFERWDDVWISEALVNWQRNGTIHKFLRTYTGKPEVKFRFWDPRKKEMTYLQIRFPIRYAGVPKIFLKDMITESEGVRFCFIFMRQILWTQVMEDGAEQCGPEAPVESPKPTERPPSAR